MKRGKEYIKKKSDEPDTLYSKLKKTTPQFRVVTNGHNHVVLDGDKQREINKEIIRRLRIQNKKLIEQVVRLKEESKKTRFNKSQVLNHINDLLKLVNR